MTVTVTPEKTTRKRNALALIITNAYRARHNMPPLDRHASVDEDIAEAILSAGWTAEELAQATAPSTGELPILDEALRYGVGSVKSARAKHVRNIAVEVMAEHSDWTDRNDEHAMKCVVDSAPWPCPEYETAKAAYLYSGGNPEEI